MAELKLNNVIGMSESSSTITLGSAGATKVSVATGKDLETSTTGKIKQKGAFMQNSVHQSWVLGG
jgi:hypothetical protein